MRTRRLPLAALLLLCLVPAASVPVSSQTSEALGKGEDAVLLEERLDIEIASLTSARVRYLNRTQVLTSRGVEQHDGAGIGYGPDSTIKSLRGAVVSPT